MTTNVLILRTCNGDMTSHGGFRWPESGPVSAPDWNPEPICGGGLHGLLWGEGDGGLLDWASGAKWLVCSVAADRLVGLSGKVKFPSCEVVHCGDQQSATAYLIANGGRGYAVNGGTATAGYAGTICIRYWNGKRYKNRIAQIRDEDGDGTLEPNQAYRLNDQGEFVLVVPS